MKSFKLALKSLIFRRKQYLSLMLVSLFGVGISLFCLYLVDGMLDALQYKAKIYYGGDLQLMGGDYSMIMYTPDEVIANMGETFPKDAVIAKRFDFDADYAAFYFEGTGVRQRVIKGIDFNTERQLFSNWNFSSGGIDDIAGTNGVLLSEPIAQMLEVQVGDEVTFLLRDCNWQINTVPLIVKGIFKDSSLFGMYTSYMDANVLKRAYGFPEQWCNRICIFFPNGAPTEQEIKDYQSALEQKFRMFPLQENKQVFYDNIWSMEMPGYALIKLSANLQDIQILIDAMKLIAAFVIVMLVIIIVAGISSTFRVIVIKRINEIGIYKAIGIKRSKIMGMLLCETGLLVVAGCILGFIFSLILCALSGCFSLSFIPAFDIFLTNGFLKPKISFAYFVIISLAVIVTTCVAVLFAIRKSVKIMPCEALAATE